MSEFSLAGLEAVIAERAASGAPDSWTARIVSGGMRVAARKFGEEAVETMIAALSGDKAELVSESADLLYHWLVVLSIAGVPLDLVFSELERRAGKSGIAEKMSRKRD